MKLVLPTIGPEPSRLAALLRERGHEVAEIEVGRIVYYPEALKPIDLSEFSHIVVTSRHARRVLVPEKSPQVCCRGLVVSPQSCCRGLVVAPQPVPDDTQVIEIGSRTSAEFIRYLREILPGDAKILRLKAKNCADSLAELANFYDYRAVEVYENVETVGDCPRGGDNKPTTTSFDAAVFTCASNARRFMKLGISVGRAYAIGETTAAELRRRGLAPTVSPRADYVSLADLIGR